MQRIPALDVAQAPAASRALLEAVQAKLGMIPNIYRTLAHAPAVLEGFFAHDAALQKGFLSVPMREQIALTLAGANGCDYCASAHTLIGGNAGLSKEETERNLQGKSSDPKVQTALTFVRAIVAARGHITDADFDAVRKAGYKDGEIVEILAHVGASMFTNYFNHVNKTEVDFPLVRTDNLKKVA